jgi:hypothetical protein
MELQPSQLVDPFDVEGVEEFPEIHHSSKQFEAAL